MQCNATQRNAIRRDVGNCNAMQCNTNMQQEQDSTSNTSAYVSFSYDESAILGYI